MVKGRNRAGQIRAIKSKRVSFDNLGISKLPSTSGMYKIGCGTKASYVGSTNNLRRRAQEHKQNGNDGCYFSFVQTRSRKQAYNIERNKIRNSCPPRNKTKPNSCKSTWERLLGF